MLLCPRHINQLLILIKGEDYKVFSKASELQLWAFNTTAALHVMNNLHSHQDQGM